MSSPKRTLSTFRVHLVITIVAVVGTFALVIGAAMFAPLVAQLDRADLDRAALAGIAEAILQLHASYWPVALVMLVASVASALLLFGRMTAPLVRFVRAFESVTRGEIPRSIRIRRSDYLQDEAVALNHMLARLGERAASRQLALARIEEALAELEACPLEPKASAALGQALEGLRTVRDAD